MISISNKKSFDITSLSLSAHLKDNNILKLLNYSKKNNILKEHKCDNIFEELEQITRCIKNTIKRKIRKLEEDEKEAKKNILDWLVVVNNKLTNHDATYILSIDLIDKLMDKQRYDVEGLHMLSITSLFIASKFHEVLPISLNQIVSKIGHKKFTRNEIKVSELYIFEALQFIIPKNYFLDFSFCLIKYLSSKDNLKAKKIESDGKLPLIYTKRSKAEINTVKMSKFAVQKRGSSKLLVEDIKNLNLNSARVITIKNEKSYSSIFITPELEKEYENIVYKFSIYIYKMLRIENDIFSNTETLTLYLSIVHFAIIYINNLLNLKGKTCPTLLFKFAESIGISVGKITNTTENIRCCFNKSKSDNEKYKYLNQIELVNFSN